MERVGELLAKLQDVLRDFKNPDLEHGEKLVSGIARLRGTHAALEEVKESYEAKEKKLDEQIKTLSRLQEDYQAAKDAFGRPTKEELQSRVQELEMKLEASIREEGELKEEQRRLLQENGRLAEEKRALVEEKRKLEEALS